MCGLAGIFHYAEPTRPIDREALTRMTRSIAHRGPDDEGFMVAPGIGLGHRRLSIIDLSPTGAQPMATPDKRCWIAYNGEFYNHAQFRPALTARGVQFRGSSDTETLLHLVRHDGPEALREAAGIFAFAYWDAEARRLTLARDPLGVKQLYVHDDGRRVVFASEIKALLECADVPRALDPEAVNQYLHFHTPLFERTFFRDVRQLRPGEFLQIDRGGVHARTYWKLEAEDFGAREVPVDELRDRLGHVVSDQLLSDVPVGAFFSGGVDSTAIAAYAQRAGRSPRCFGVHFTNQGVIDERPYQESAARALGVTLDLITIDGSNFATDLMKLMYFQDQPVIGPAMLPMYYVAQLAAQHVKVVLGGQAADEVFGGYARYGLVHPVRVGWSMLQNRLRSRHARSGAITTPREAQGGNLWKQLVDPRTLRRLAGGVTHAFDWRARYFETFAQVPEAIWHEVFDAKGLVSRAACRNVFETTLAQSPATDPADLVMHWDMQTYLTGLFQQDDRMSMANSLESRVPMADPRLVRFAFGIGFANKFRDGATKWLLRQAVSDVIPAEVLHRRKVGFDTPVDAWMRGPHQSFVRDLLTSRAARERGLWNPAGVARWLDRQDHPLWLNVVWKMVCIEAWARIYLDGEKPVVESPALRA